MPGGSWVNSGAQRGHTSRVGPWLSAVSVMAGTFMVVLDSSVVNVSLPHIAGALSATVAETTWALTSYLAATAIILPMTGWLARYVGRKRLLLVSVSAFTGASFLCGLAPNLGALIVSRILQGTAGGLMQPLSQAVMLESFPPRRRGEAMAFWGLGIVVAPILGPLLGGWLTEDYSWRWIFFINIPVGLGAFAMMRRWVFDPPYLVRRSDRIDIWGVGLLTVGIGALQIALDKGQEDDWLASRFIVILLLVSTLAIVTLVWHELRVQAPVVDFNMARERTYGTGLVLITLMGFVLYGSLVLLPILLQTLMGYPPWQAGMAMAPRGLGTLLITPVIGWLLTRVDPRVPLATGFAGGAVTLFALGQLDLSADYWSLFWPQLAQGLAFGMLFVPLTTVTMDPIPNERIGEATSLFNLLRNLGGSAGIATMETLLARQTQVHLNTLGAHVTAYDAETQTALRSLQSLFASHGADTVTASARAHATLYGLVVHQAAMLAFIDAFRLLACVFVAVAPMVFLMRRPQQATGGANA